MTWLYVPQTNIGSSNCVPASECSASESTLLNLERVQSLTLRGKPTQPRHWLRVWKRANWLRRLSGLTLEPSTVDALADWFIASLRETPASRTASPARASAPTMSDSLSTRSSASMTKAGLIVSSARTSQGTPTDNSQHSSRLWRTWVAALRQEFSLRPRPAQATSESDCSSWPAARDRRDEQGLDQQARTWPTPRARDHKGGGPTTERADGRTRLDQLDYAAEQWKSSSLQDQPIGDGQQSSPPPRSLNPRFVELLMGWPVGWTDSEPVETGLSLWLLRMRGALCLLCSREPEDQPSLF